MKYYDAYNEVRTKNPKESYRKDYEAILEQTFDNSANVFYDEIEFEYIYGSNKFSKIPKVRVDTVINYNSSMVVDGDDYKTFVFMPDFPRPKYGMKFRWNDNYWLVINTNNAESLSTSALVRRCNNVLRFFDDNGNKIYEPCIMDTTLRFTNNNDTNPVTDGNNEQKIWCQRNPRTTSIRPNDKFLFGSPNQRIAFRLYAGGMKNEINTSTMDDNSPSLTEFYMEHYQINAELDDLVNGFANAYANDFSIEIDNIADTYMTGKNGQLTAKVKKNNKIVDMNIDWCSSDDSIIRINKEEGYFTTLAEGECKLYARLEENHSIMQYIKINVNDNPEKDDNDIIITPDNIDYILQGDNLELDSYLYINGEKQNLECQFFDISKNVPKENYFIEILGNNKCKIYNKKMFMKEPIIIKCKIGDFEKNIYISLRGLY